VLEGESTNFAKRSEADGRTFAVVLANPKVLGAVRFSYSRSPEYFAFKSATTAACLTPTIGYYGEGTLRAFPSYGQIEMVLDGRPYAITLAREKDVLSASLATMKLAGIRITDASRHGRVLRLAGVVAPGAHSDTVSVSISAQPTAGPPVNIMREASLKNGQGSGTVQLPASADGVPVRVTLTYPGDWEYAPGSAVRTVQPG